VLRIAISPGWTEIGQLWAIVLLRMILNFGLQLEIDRAYDEQEWDLEVNCQLEFQLGKLGYFTEKTYDSIYPIGGR
jgi:Protein of unknown function (DUF1622)